MISDQHRLSRFVGRVEATGGVGKDYDLGSGKHGGADRMNHLCRRAALVEMGSADEQQDPVPTEAQRADLALVAGDGGRYEAGKLRGRSLKLCGSEPVGYTLPTRPEDDGDIVWHRARPADDLVGGLSGRIEGIRRACDRHDARG